MIDKNLLIQTIIAISSLLTAFVTFFTVKQLIKQNLNAKVSLELSQKILKAEIHHKFQNEIREIQKVFTYNVNDKDWSPSNAEKRNVRLYWYLVFDEWLTCTIMNPELSSLWEMYSNGVKSALQIDYFYHDLTQMLTSQSAFLGYKKQFMIEINRLRQL